jgi:tRNA threonylcarbamoyladenosine biosynthesis protein TsaE
MAGDLTLIVPDPEATDAIGAALAPHLLPGDVVTLTGDLGAGKSALARAIIRARLGDPQLEVPSPSFALVQPYPGLIHADLYRLADESEIEELGLLDEDEAIVIVEWPDRAPTLSERSGLAIAIAMGPGDGRTMTVRAQADRDLKAVAGALDPWVRP